MRVKVDLNTAIGDEEGFPTGFVRQIYDRKLCATHGIMTRDALAAGAEMGTSEFRLVALAAYFERAPLSQPFLMTISVCRQRASTAGNRSSLFGTMAEASRSTALAHPGLSTLASQMMLSGFSSAKN